MGEDMGVPITISSQRGADTAWHRGDRHYADPPPPPPDTPPIEGEDDRGSAHVATRELDNYNEDAHAECNEEILTNYCKGLDRDTFSFDAVRLQIGTEQQGGEWQAKLNFPPACPIRSTFVSDRCATAASAKRQVVASAINELTAEGLLDAQLQPTVIALVQPPADIQWPLQPPDEMSLEALEIMSLRDPGISAWPKSMVLTTIKLTPEQHDWSSIGYLSAHATPAEKPVFALQLNVGLGDSLLVNMESRVIHDWPPSAGATAHILAYNHIVLPDGPDTIAMVPLREGDIDWGRICSVTSKDKEENEPAWLLPLCKRIASLRRVEQMGRLAPIGPVPNPLRMEVVLSGGFGEGGQAFQALSLLGRAVLKMLFSITYYVEHPFDDARRLQQRVQAATTPERFAALVAKSGLLAEVIHTVDWMPRLSGVDIEIAEQMLTALVGAYVAEKGGDFYSAAKLWQWLTDSDEIGTAVRYIDFAPTEFKGRSPSYKYFWQAEAEDGTLELCVYYGGRTNNFDDLGEVRYRRPAVGGGENVLGQFSIASHVGDDENDRSPWVNVQYDHGRATYVWTAFQDMEARPAALPNKVQRWLRGTPAVALTTYNRCGQPTLVYEALREMRDGSLRVLYKNHGWYHYRRCHKGGLGLEAPASPGGRIALPVRCSETKGAKTLLSPNFEGEFLPNKVSEWLLTGQSLCTLISVAPDENSLTEDVQVTEHEDDCITWKSGDGQHWKCSREYVGSTIVFTAGVIVSTPAAEKLHELMYVEKVCMTVDRVPIPAKVVKWMKKHPQREADEKVFRAYIEQRREASTTMCMEAPVQMKRWTSRSTQSTSPMPLDLSCLEASLQYKFCNRLLLTEALLMVSGSATEIIPDFQRLVVVGHSIAEQLVTRILIENASFSIAATLSQHDRVSESKKENITFAVGQDATFLRPTDSTTYRWPQARGGLSYDAEWPHIDAIDVSTPELLNKRRDACCNNVAYARTCVELGLHNAMIQGSPELERSVKAFANTVQHTLQAFEKTGENPWPRLLHHDAPRALGNTFVACLGAMVMDGGQFVQNPPSYTQVKKLLVKHVQQCQNMPVPDHISSHDINDVTRGDIEKLQKDQLLRHRRPQRHGGAPSTTLNYAAVTPLLVDAPCETQEPTPVHTLSPRATQTEHMRQALQLTDVHFRVVNGILVDARSPRTAELRGTFIDLEEELGQQEEEESTTNEDVEATGVPGIWVCEACGDEKQPFYCNSKTQLAAHIEGNVHKKNVNRGGVARQSNKNKARTPRVAPDICCQAGLVRDTERSGAEPRPSMCNSTGQFHGAPPPYSLPPGDTPNLHGDHTEQFHGSWEFSGWSPLGYAAQLPAYGYPTPPLASPSLFNWGNFVIDWTIPMQFSVHQESLAYAAGQRLGTRTGESVEHTTYQ